MTIISVEEITRLHKTCGLDSSVQYSMRKDINTGSLENKLNTSFAFLNKILFYPSASSYNTFEISNKWIFYLLQL